MYVKKGDAEFEKLLENDPESEIPKHIKLVLEEQPKWALLKNVLKEIEVDSMALNQGQGAPVLVMVTERRTCSQLKKYITTTDQDEPFLNKLAHNFFKWRVNMHKIQTNVAPPLPPPVNTRGGAPANKRRRVRGGSTTASGPGRSGTLAETFKDDVIETVSL